MTMEAMVPVPRTTWKEAVRRGVVDAAMAAVYKVVQEGKHTDRVVEDVMRHYSALVSAFENFGTTPAVAVVSAAMLICYYADKVIYREVGETCQKRILQ